MANKSTASFTKSIKYFLRIHIHKLLNFPGITQSLKYNFFYLKNVATCPNHFVSTSILLKNFPDFFAKTHSSIENIIFMYKTVSMWTSVWNSADAHRARRSSKLPKQDFTNYYECVMLRVSNYTLRNLPLYCFLGEYTM